MNRAAASRVAVAVSFPQLALGDIFYRTGQAKPAYYAEARPHLEKYTQLKSTYINIG